MASADPPDFALQVSLMGEFRLCLNGHTLKRLGSRAGNWLFGYLAMHRGEIVDRAELASILWPKSPEPAARDNLRHCLTDLRKSLGEEGERCIKSPTLTTLTLDLDGCDVDVFEFDRLISSDAPGDLERGLYLYQGPLLKGWAGGWVDVERERLLSRYQEALERFAQRSEPGVRPGDALPLMERAFDEDQLSEAAARALMGTYAASGNYSAATQTYKRLRLRLRRTFGSDPEAATASLYIEIQKAERAEAAAERRSERGRSAASAASTPAAPLSAGSSASSGIVAERLPGYVPEPITDLIGRDDALWSIMANMESSRLVTLTGPGGIGKTQLAVAAARLAWKEYSAGVWFVDLSAIRKASAIPAELLAVLGESAGIQEAEAALCRALGDQAALLVLDNCEHLAPGCTGLVRRVLERCRNIRILATSHKSLRVPGEYVFKVPPLTVPRPRHSGTGMTAAPISPATLATLLDCSAIALFADRAAQSRRRFAVSAENIAGVVGICRRLDGVPLAIELAAPWVRSLSIKQIRERLDKHFDLLKSRDPSVADRHRTLPATVDWSYNLLSEEEQRVWRQVSLFAEGFTLEAAEAVCGAKPEDSRLLDSLTGLIDSSVLQHAENNEEGRYRLPETMRQYGLARQEWDDEERIRAYERYIAYYAGLGDAAAPHLVGADQAVWLSLLDRERGNIRAAFEYAKCTIAASDGLRLAAAIWRYDYVRGYYSDGYRTLVAMLRQGTAAPRALRASAHTAAGNLALHSGKPAAAKIHFETAYQLQLESGDRPGQARSLTNLALISNEQGEYTAAFRQLELSRDLFVEMADVTNLSAALGNLAITACHMEDYETSYRFHRKSIDLFRQSGDLIRVGMGLANLAGVYVSQKEYLPALPLVSEALQISLNISSPAILAHGLYLTISLASEWDDFETAALVCGAHTFVRREYYLPLPQDAIDELETLIESVREAVGADAFRHLKEQGSAMSHEAIVLRLARKLTEWEEDRAPRLDSSGTHGPIEGAVPVTRPPQ